MNVAEQASTILGPDGTPVEKPLVRLSFDDAQLLYAYQAWGNREGFAAEMVCGDCHKPCETFVQPGQIGIFCDCKTRLWRAS